MAHCEGFGHGPGGMSLQINIYPDADAMLGISESYSLFLPGHGLYYLQCDSDDGSH